MLFFCKGFQALKLPFRNLPSIQDKDVLIKYHLSFLLQAQLLVTLFRSVRALFPACYILRRKDEVGIMQTQHGSLTRCHILLTATTVQIISNTWEEKHTHSSKLFFPPYEI